MDSSKNTFSIILAAGQSKRMKESKIVLPWGSETVISHIITTFQAAGLKEIVVVTGGYKDLVEPEVEKSGARSAFNPEFANDEMSISLKTGLRCINLEKYSGGFIALGDQPNIFADDLEKMINLHIMKPGKIIIPSFNMRRGHPWLIPQVFFRELIELCPPETMRTFLKRHENDIEYVLVERAEILSDMDTPQDYEQLKPK
jgi:molybdenum cofactor cytidylyltransferase